MEDAFGIGEIPGEPGGARAASAAARPFGTIADLPSRLWRLGQLYFGQAGLILRGRESHRQPCALFTPPAGARLLDLPTPCGRRVAALFGPALSDDGSRLADAPRRPTVLFFYGNGMCLAESQAIFQHLRCIGANVLIPEYLGYGLSDRGASERGCYATADAALRHLQTRPDVDPKLIVPTGVSLGGAVAIDLASREPSIAGLIAVVTFTSIPAMARHLHPDVPVWRFIHLKFDSIAKMPSVSCPMLIGHSTADALVPGWMTDRLASAAGGPVTRFVIEGANHHAAEMLEVGADVMFSAAREFLAGLAPARN